MEIRDKIKTNRQIFHLCVNLAQFMRMSYIKFRIWRYSNLNGDFDLVVWPDEILKCIFLE